MGKSEIQVAFLEADTSGLVARREFLELVDASVELHRPWTYPPADAASYRRLLERNRGDDFYALFARRTEVS